MTDNNAVHQDGDVTAVIDTPTRQWFELHLMCHNSDSQCMQA